MRRYRLTAVVWREGRRYVAKCPELGVASFGATPDRAKVALEDAASLYLSNARKLGLLRELEPTLNSRSRFTSPLDIAVA